MKKSHEITEEGINTALRSSMEKLTPDEFPAILGDCKERKDKKMDNITTIKPNKRKHVLRYLAAAAAFLLIVGCAFGLISNADAKNVYTTVMIDVNPSVQINANKNERVLSVTPLNRDGEVIIGELDFSGSTIDVAVNAVIGSMLKHGYITETRNAILISVMSKDKAEAAELNSKLYTEVNAQLSASAIDASVLSQDMTDSNTESNRLADEYGISCGKAQLIDTIITAGHPYTFEELAHMSISALNGILNGTIDTDAPHHNGGSHGESDNVGSEEAALAIALEHAGVTLDQLSWYEICLDFDDGIWVYEVEFVVGNTEYEYEINAITGEIIKFETELDDDPHGAPPVTERPTQQPGSNFLSEDEIRAIVFNHAGVNANDVREFEIELDDEHGIWVYEVEFKAGNIEYDYVVNAVTGEIIKSETEVDDDPTAAPGTPRPTAQPTQQPGSEFLSEDEIRAIVFNHAGVNANDVREFEIELDDEDGIWVYEVDFKAGNIEYDYVVNAVTGAIIRVETEIDDDPTAAPGTPRPTAQPTQQPGSELLSEDEIRAIVFSHAGVNANDVREFEIELDDEDGIWVYEVEFESGRHEYSYEVNALTGEIIDYEIDD
ncbi:MAG: PepSY domain-containing protein [Eubacteriales bacterium]|nr:PepSY domain-containing protein [Eubacteriales bacterium]